MPNYSYLCRDCQRTIEQYAKAEDYEKPIPCECGKVMIRTFGNVGTDLVDNVRYSSVMGVNPNKINEAMHSYPGSTYTPDGRLIIRNRKDKLNKLRQRNMVEFE
jgi:putative FmdB family regulatory protein